MKHHLKLTFFRDKARHFVTFTFSRWVNIGKERDGMSPDAVQYARALRPPYHLLSFLRIKGHSTKGMSCTDKNTMVSAVYRQCEIFQSPDNSLIFV